MTTKQAKAGKELIQEKTTTEPEQREPSSGEGTPAFTPAKIAEALKLGDETAAVLLD